ncbi:hypothetical protein NXS19_010086 [Fusarium pseudograminearum]|nr:hypothetical protein NXS19_010086 [Fusarium pseudograminearum]
MRGTSAIILPSLVGVGFSITNKDFPVGTTSYPKATTTVGESTSTTSEEPSPTSIAYPTNTLINQEDGEGYCFEDSSSYEEFTIEDAQRVIGSFCDSSYTLDPKNDFGHNSALENDGIQLLYQPNGHPIKRDAETRSHSLSLRAPLTMISVHEPGTSISTAMILRMATMLLAMEEPTFWICQKAGDVFS